MKKKNFTLFNLRKMYPNRHIFIRDTTNQAWTTYTWWNYQNYKLWNFTVVKVEDANDWNFNVLVRGKA